MLINKTSHHARELKKPRKFESSNLLSDYYMPLENPTIKKSNVIMPQML